MFACVEEDRVPQMMVPQMMLLFFFVMRACNRRCLELVRHGFTSESLVVLVGDLRFKSGNRNEFLRLCSF